MTADATLPASDDLTPEVLARWEELAAKATEGPWEIIGGGEYVTGLGVGIGADEGIRAADAEFVSAARAAVPALLSGVRSLQAENIELRDGYEAWKRAGTATHNALLAIWHLVTPYDTKHMTFDPDDPDSVVDAVRSRDARIVELEQRVTEAEAEALRKKVDYEWQSAQVDELAVDISLLEEQHEDDLKAIADRDARIGELEGVIARALAEADDWSKSPPGESAPTRAVGDLFADILRPGATNG